MSKFYYSGTVKQVNFLTPRQALIRRYAGKWQLLLFQGILDLLTAFFPLIYLIFKNLAFSEEPTLLSFVLCICALVNAGICFLSYLFLKSRIYKSFLKMRAIVDLVLAVILLLIPNFFVNLIYYSLLSLIFVVCLRGLLLRKGFLMIVLDLLGLAFVFVNFLYLSYIYPYRIYLIYFLLGLVGLFYIYVSLKNRKQLGDFESEQLGFTDFKIY